MGRDAARFLFSLLRHCRFCHHLLRFAVKHFSRILPVKTILETEHALVIQHPSPTYPLHLLILPKAGWRNLSEVEGTSRFWSEMPCLVERLAAENNLENQGYRLIINSGEYQDVELLHLHFVSGYNQVTQISSDSPSPD
ncbi:MAG TPA: HIT domain-containing protein [Chloroflexi bacterium]|nr:HIT domain-containing protein [Chloroflexota bacterium]